MKLATVGCHRLHVTHVELTFAFCDVLAAEDVYVSATFWLYSKAIAILIIDDFRSGIDKSEADEMDAVEPEPMPVL